MPAEFTFARAPEPVLRPAGTRPLRPRAFAALARSSPRGSSSPQHLTLLGWGWPVARQPAQLAVLVFVFGKVLDLDADNHPVFVFVSLMAWTWLSGVVSAAAASVLSQRRLVMQPRLPAAVLPGVAAVVAVSAALLMLGQRVFTRLAPRFADLCDRWPSGFASRRCGRLTRAGARGRCARRSTGACRGSSAAASSARSCATSRSQ